MPVRPTSKKNSSSREKKAPAAPASEAAPAPENAQPTPTENKTVPSFWTTHLSSKGQVVIPEQIRKDFGFEPGDKFVVVALNDLVFLKRL